MSDAHLSPSATTAAGAPSAPFEAFFTTTRDGLQLYGRHYALQVPSDRPRRTALCLPGITRNSRDFHVLASALASDPVRARAVVTLDFRGRGGSQWAPDPATYTVPVEMLDVIDVITARALSDLAIIGTSRGGMVGNALAVALPSAVGAMVLNDIGPVIEADGLSRIAGYVGRTPTPHSWADAVRVVKEINARQFPRVDDREWLEVARQLFDDADGTPAAAYDPKLAAALSVLQGAVPPMWELFETLKRVPLLVLRGELSDLLSAATVDEMGRRHPRMTAHTVRWQGHAPFLRDRETIGVVADFLAACDG